MTFNGLNIWGSGQILAFSGLDGKTDYNNGLVLRTAFDYKGFDIKLPENGGMIKLQDFDADNITLSGDFFSLGKTRGAFIDAWHVLLEGDVQIEINNELKQVSENGRTLVGSSNYFKPELIKSDLDEVITERRRQFQKFPVPENLEEDSRLTLLKAYSQLRTQFCSPEGNIKALWTTPDRWPHRRMWLWDSVFHSAGIRHIDVKLAREIISAMLGCAREDGFIPLDVTPDKISEVTQPPLLALGVKLVQEREADIEWLKECYPYLKGYIEWDLKNRDSNGSGLVEWYIEEHENCRSGESGMDNSPRFDSATQLEATDFNAFLSMECEILAEFAQELGFSDDVELWKVRHEKLNKLINKRLWNDREKFYFDYDIDHDKMSEVMASSGFLPLICGAASKEQAAELVAHLKNPKTFNTSFLIPSIAVSCNKFYAKDMWRGPVWININWLVVKGLRRYGFDAEADLLIKQTMEKIEEMYLKYGTFFEFYDDRNEVDPPELFRKGKNIPNSFHQVFHDYGWTGTLYIDFVFEKMNNNPKL
jgi:glycogen debranching enzyme